MSTIVKHTPTGRRFIYLGAGYHAHPNTPPGAALIGGSSQYSESERALAAVCDAEGRIYWCESKELTVESVDGSTPSDLLK